MSDPDDTIDGSDSARNPLELLAAEYSAARRNGANPSIDDYVRRVPGQEAEARALLESLAMLERVSEQELSRYAQHRRQHRLVQKNLEQLGDYRIIREIGRGGMGIIYEAEQITLKRRVALKVLSTQSQESARQLERFQREAEAIARLHHTNIVPVFGSGSENGVHYFAMQLIDGQPLSQLPDLSFAEIGRLGMQAASALAYAHAHGVLHRDVKPSNLLLDKSGEVWVTDFGLAKLSDVGELTQTGDIMGTLKYMAPEQLEGRADERTDIYSLGLTLYELATRKPAFDISKSLANRIRNHEIAAPRHVNPDVPRDLETIILKATAFESVHRYATASELADDLRCFLEDRPIAARRASAMERLSRWTRRNPALAATSIAASLLLITTTIVTSVGLVTTRAALDDAQKARDTARQASQQADRARQQAVENQNRAEKNLNVALEAFDSIFDNVAQRGVPQSLSIDLQASASPGSGTANPASNNASAADPQSDSAATFEVTLSSADAELLNSLLKFYAQFAEGNGNDSALRSRTATAYHRIGQIQLRLGRGAAAIESYNEALKLWRLTHKQSPHDQPSILAIAKILNDRGLALSTMARPVPQIVWEHKQAIQFLESQPPEIGRLAEVRYEMARGFDLAGSLLGRTGVLSDDAPQWAQGKPFAWRRFGVFGPPPDGGLRPDGPPPNGPPPNGPPPNGPPPNGPPPDGPPPDGPRFDGPPPDGPRPDDRFGPWPGERTGPPPRDGGGGVGGNGGAGQPHRFGANRPNGKNPIEGDLLRAAEIFEQISLEYPERHDFLLSYAQSQRHLMLYFLSNGRMPEAAESFDIARTSLDRLLKQMPRDPNVLLEYADTLSTASARLNSLDSVQAEQYLRQAIDTCQQLCESFPSVPEYQAILANSHDRLGIVEQAKHHWLNAEAAFKKSIDRLARLGERFPDNRYYQVSMLQAATHLGELRSLESAGLNSQPHRAEAIELLDKALAAYRQAFLLEPMAGSIVEKAQRVRQQLEH